MNTDSDQNRTACDAVSTALDVRNLCAGFGSVQVFAEISFRLAAAQTLVVLGESGCGKTTLLRAVAGLIPIQSGAIQLMGSDITRSPVSDRQALYMDQEPLLFEPLSVFDNVAFALRMKKISDAEIRSSVDELLHMTELADHADKRHHQLSGGQKQRVAFARAILAKPQLLLLDEPLSSLDSRTRAQMRSLFASLSQRYGLTSIFVTHDVKEALVVGHQFARMSAGRFQLYDSRQAFMADPATGVAAEVAFWEFAAKREDKRTGES